MGFRIRRWTLFWLSIVLLIGVGAGSIGWQQWVKWRYGSTLYTPEEAPSARVALVLGARVYGDGRLSGMLRDRVETAIALYKAGKVDKLLMSGDNSQPDYNEPGAMVAYALQQGVAPAALQPDYGGRRTYDSCYRAKEIFQVEQLLVVTQAFHLPRALFLCSSLGLQASGVVADRRPYHPRSIAWSETREIPAMAAALFDILWRVPPPVMGDPIPLE
jgi:SanA protein